MRMAIVPPPDPGGSGRWSATQLTANVTARTPFPMGCHRCHPERSSGLRPCRHEFQIARQPQRALADIACMYEGVG